MIQQKQDASRYRNVLVGKQAKIESNNKMFQGKIILETKNTIKIETKEGTKTILKKNAEITINQKKIKGKTIIKRTEDRIKFR